MTDSNTTVKTIGGRDYIFFNITYNHHRDVGGSSENAMLDRADMRTAECVLCLPESYREDGYPTQLVLASHGAGGRVCAEDGIIGGLGFASDCVSAGYALLDVCGSEPHGTTMGCPEHIFALYKAYRYAIRHYNLSERVLLTGASMGGHVAMNFANTFPGIVTAVGIFCPRLHMDGLMVDGHYCIGTWDKTTKGRDGTSTRDKIVNIYRFPDETWNDERTCGFNPHRTRAFTNTDGEKVILPPCPIKIWQGTADTTVDPVGVQAYVDAVRRSGSYIELHMLDGVGHTVTPVMREELLLWFERFI